MSKVTVQYLKTGKTREMQKRYADALVKMKIVAYLTRDIPEAPIFKLTPEQPFTARLDFESDQDSTAAIEPSDDQVVTRTRGRRRNSTAAASVEEPADAGEPQE